MQRRAVWGLGSERNQTEISVPFVFALLSCSISHLLSPLALFVYFCLPSVARRLPYPRASKESKAVAPNYSQLQKYCSVMVGPVSGLASRRWMKAGEGCSWETAGGWLRAVPDDQHVYFTECVINNAAVSQSKSWHDFWCACCKSFLHTDAVSK